LGVNCNQIKVNIMITQQFNIYLSQLRNCLVLLALSIFCRHLFIYLFIYYENRTHSTSKKKTNTDRKKRHKNTDTHIKKMKK